MKYGSKVAARVEELLREQLEELGETPGAIAPHDMAANMRCEIWPDDTMIYMWKTLPILRVSAERHDDGSVTWRMFTRDDEGDDFALYPTDSLTCGDGPLLDMDRARHSGVGSAAATATGEACDDDDDLDEDLPSTLLDDEDSGNDDMGDEEGERPSGGYPMQ